MPKSPLLDELKRIVSSAHLEAINHNSLALTKSILKASTTIVNRNRDRESCCRNPLEGLNNRNGEPLT